MRILVLVVLALLALAGCGGAQGNTELPYTAPQSSPTSSPLPSIPSQPTPVVPAPTQKTRVTERDVDADGIADYRVFVTESFDAEGNLVAVTRERDFEADGVIDARETTNFR